VDRRHLLKALFTGLTLAGISLPAFSAAKTTVTKAKQALKTTKTTGTATKAAATTSSKTSTKTAAKPAATSTTKTAAKTPTKTAQSTKGGKTTARYQTAHSKSSAKGGKTTVARSSGRGSRSVYREQDSEFVSRLDPNVPLGTVRAVSLDIVNTGEKGREIVYFENGQYQADALFELNLLLRDWRADKVRAIDPKLFDALYMLNRMTGARTPFEIVSAYRSPLTNFTLLLEGDGTGVARRSLHMDGRAVDIKLPGVHLAHLNKAAVQLGYGGVGYYPGSGFVHVDTGDVRRWRA